MPETQPITLKMTDEELAILRKALAYWTDLAGALQTREYFGDDKPVFKLDMRLTALDRMRERQLEAMTRMRKRLCGD